jgi:hypothetical protein
MGWLRCLRAPRTLAQAGAACTLRLNSSLAARSEHVQRELLTVKKSSDPVGMIGLDIGKNAGTHHAAVAARSSPKR